MKKPLCFVVTLAFLASPVAMAAPETPRSEKIFGYYVHDRGIAFQVFSGGCTDKDSFKAIARPGGEVELLRVRHDACLALFPHGVFVQYSYPELGLRKGQGFRVMNTLRPPTPYEPTEQEN